MEKKNTKLMILVAVLLVGIGISLAYYMSSVTSKGEGALVDATTTVIQGAELKVEGVLNFTDTNIYPGHKNVASVKVTATGNNELIPYNLIWSGINTINTPLNYTVYKTSSEINVSASCDKKNELTSNGKALFEECTISNIDTLGDSIASGSINKDDTKVILTNDEFITATPTGDIKYYYIILEYPNLDMPQNSDAKGTLNGKIHAEESNAKADINILAAYVIQDNGEYKQVDDIPQSGYVINTSKSTCSNGANPTGRIPNITINNLTKSGTSCYLYFDKQILGADQILANVTVKNETPDFSAIATTDEGVYSTTDGMYSGTTYYWRGKVENNYVKFAGFCWRIIRINGDKTIRMIYDGTTCHANGANTAENIALTSQAYNPTYNASYYVGWTQNGSQRTNSTSATPSNAKTQIESWYTSNITGTNATKVADGKYCNDRDVTAAPSSWSGYVTTWSANGTQFAYAGPKRLYESYSPTFSCPSGDVYTLKVGLITADEVEFAGGKNENNTSYYLYNGQNYWTMSPSHWDGTRADVFLVDSYGYLSNDYVHYTDGLRPVINLKADTTFATGGTGTQSNPYVVS